MGLSQKSVTLSEAKGLTTDKKHMLHIVQHDKSCFLDGLLFTSCIINNKNFTSVLATNLQQTAANHDYCLYDSRTCSRLKQAVLLGDVKGAYVHVRSYAHLSGDYSLGKLRPGFPRYGYRQACVELHGQL